MMGMKNTNKRDIVGDTLIITTKKGDMFLADAEDIEKLERYSWCANAGGYAVANNGKKIIRMHRYIMGVTDPKMVVDHVNNDISDNRKSNLRICTQAENVRNRSGKNGYIGIRKTPFGKYNVRITINRKEIHIGNYGSIDEAIRARHEAENVYHGKYASHKNK